MGDDDRTTYISISGLKLNFNEIKSATNFENITRLDEEQCFSNGLMSEFKEKVPSLFFYEFIKCVVPLSIVPEMEEHDKNSFKSKIQVFDKMLKKEKKGEKGETQ